MKLAVDCTRQRQVVTCDYEQYESFYITVAKADKRYLQIKLLVIKQISKVQWIYLPVDDSLSI